MRRITSLLFAGALAAMLSSMTYDSVNPDGKNGYAGSPNELTCAKAGCHDSFALNSGTGSVTITAPTLTNWQYVPGQTYAINVTVAKSGINLYGLCFESLRSTGANGGTLTAGTGTHTGSATVMGNARTCITHNQDGGIGTGSHTFTFNWTAPATNIGNVTFYVAGLCANGNTNELSDYVYSTSQVVTPLSAPTSPSIAAGGATTFCAGGSVTLSVSQVTGETYTWFNASNTQVGTGTSFNATATGCYHVTATNSGGSASSTSDVCVTVNPSPNAAFAGLTSSVCNTGSAMTLVPTVSGGTFTGTGVSSNSFNPSGLAAGTYSVNYAVTSGGCSANTTQSITVSAPANAAFTGLSSSYCAGDPVATLVPTTAGGTFQGNSVSGSTFNPSSVGSSTVTYTVVSGACTTSTQASTTVNAVPVSTYSGLPSSVCTSDAAVTLSPTTNGGTFSGSGVSGSTFNPSTASAGSQTIIYSITQNGCTSSTSHTVNVSVPANASFTGLSSSYCVGDPIVTLVPTTAGGTFQGNSVSGSTFNPTATGSSTVTYTVVSGACTTSSQATTTVNALPVSTFSGLPASVCTSDAAVTLSPTISGGTFTGSGISGSSFNPSASTPGNQTIVYSITQNGCSSNTSHAVSVSSPLDAAFSGLSSTYCSADANVVLVPTTLGGTFSGPGVAGGTFIPASGEGTYEVHYTIVNGACVSTTNASTQVFSSPNATFTGLGSGYCSDSGSAQLVAVDNTGTFSGTGIEGTSFNPSTAGVGSYTVTYTVSNSNCTSETTQNVDVYAGANSEFSGLSATYCQADVAAVLVPVQVGGVFSGDGFLNGAFDPATAGLGDHSITYSIDFGTCSSTTTYSTTVLANPDATFSGLALLYCSADAPALLVPVIEGGTFSGVGFENGAFDPAIAGTGDHTISYSVSLGNCTSTTANTTTVYGNPDASFSGLVSEYCIDGAAVLLAPVTSGGNFFGDGIFESTFVPSNAGAGSHTIFYSVTSADGCTSSSSITTVVNDLPSNGVTLQQNTLTATASGASYQWVDCATGLPIAGQTGASFTPTVTGSYSVEVTSLGCSNSSECTTIIIDNIAVIASQLTLEAYPNPSSGTVTFVSPENGQLSIYSSEGLIVSQMNVFKGSQQLQLSSFENGVYVFKMNGHQATYQSIVVIEK